MFLTTASKTLVSVVTLVMIACSWSTTLVMDSPTKWWNEQRPSDIQKWVDNYTVEEIVTRINDWGFELTYPEAEQIVKEVWDELLHTGLEALEIQKEAPDQLMKRPSWNTAKERFAKKVEFDYDNLLDMIDDELEEGVGG